MWIKAAMTVVECIAAVFLHLFPLCISIFWRLYLWISPIICSCHRPEAKQIEDHHHQDKEHDCLQLIISPHDYYNERTFTFTIITGHSPEKNDTFLFSSSFVVTSVIIPNNHTSCTAGPGNKKPLCRQCYHMQLRHFLQRHVQFCSVNNPQNSKSKAERFLWLAADYTVSMSENSLCVCYLSMTYLLKTFFFSPPFFCCSEAIWREKRTPVPKITANASEHRAHCVQSVYNCVSCEPCPPSMLGSHAPFPATLLCMRESKPI